MHLVFGRVVPGRVEDQEHRQFGSGAKQLLKRQGLWRS